MKKLTFNLFYLFVLASLLAACSDDDDGIDEPVYGKATMTSFGFYAEDNQGVLFNDYVASGISSSIAVLLPDYVDKSSLVARFEVTENDVVHVSTVQQTSGVTANDFTVPVDYIVSEGTNNTKYTVTVGNLPDAVWTMAATTTTNLREFTMKVNPASDIPYLAYVLSADEYEDQKVGTFKLDEGALVPVGAETFSEGRADNISLAFNSEGVPYVCFADYTNVNPAAPTSTTSSASVMAFNGTSWDYVGGNAGKGITDVKITYNEIVLKADDQPMLFCMNNAAGALARRELNISDFNGSTWTSSIKMPGRAASLYAYNPKAKLVNGNIYLAIYNADHGTFSVYKNVNGTWTTIVDQFLDEGATTGNLRDFDMAVDAGENIYIAVADDQAGANIYRTKVKKYTAETGTWSTIASPLEVDFSVTREFSLAVSPAGIPFLLYRNSSLFPEVVSLDTETQQWTTPVVLDASASEYLYLDFASNGIGYATFKSSSTSATVVYKYDIPQSE